MASSSEKKKKRWSMSSLALALGKLAVIMASLVCYCSFFELGFCAHTTCSDFSVSVFQHSPFLLVESMLKFNINFHMDLLRPCVRGSTHIARLNRVESSISSVL